MLILYIFWILSFPLHFHLLENDTANEMNTIVFGLKVSCEKQGKRKGPKREGQEQEGQTRITGIVLVLYIIGDRKSTSNVIACL